VKFFKDEKGAALLVEAAFIYPIVIIVVVFMIYLGMFVYESAVIHDMAATTSMMAAKSVSFPGYDELGDFCIKGGDDDTEITVGMVNKAYEDMTVEELQEAILEKMRKNGPVTDYMLGTVRDNTHKGSLINWVKSFY
jgi:hypothetical protein